jgi:hypothetical protein
MIDQRVIVAAQVAAVADGWPAVDQVDAVLAEDNATFFSTSIRAT